jgi:3'(2'), 5'-bisphosphate nucleotidase
MDTKSIAEEFVSHAIHIAIKAGGAILEVYNREDFETSIELSRKDDDSPLTAADRAAHKTITEALTAEYPDIPILSEEGRDIPYAERSRWDRFWLVDPLDGTKEFIKRNGEFTVNIALIEGGRPVLGVVYVPVRDLLYYGREGMGAFKLPEAAEVFGRTRTSTASAELQASNGNNGAIFERSEKLPFPQANTRKKKISVVASRSHFSPETEQFIESLRSKLPEDGEIELVQAGSSLKICLVAEGTADVYPRFGPTMEWDTAAGQAIAEAAGAEVIIAEDSAQAGSASSAAADSSAGDTSPAPGSAESAPGAPLRYNKENLLNPWFIVKGKRYEQISSQSSS